MNSIKYLAGIPSFYTIEHIESRGCISIIHVSCKPRNRTCPVCGGRGVIHGYKKRSMFCAPIGGMPSAIRIRQRRYRCSVCSRTWLEPDEMKSSLSAHMTEDLVALIGVELMRRQSVRSISRRFGPSEDMIYKVLDAMVTPEPYLPRVLCIDEFRANTDAGKMSVCVVDGIRGVLIDILRDRRPETLDTWFSQFSEEELESVDCFCCDMYWGFIRAAERWLPCAEICIDRFHVTRCVTKAFDKVRTRLQREVSSDIKKELKGARKLFLMRESHLRDLDAKRIKSGKEPLTCRVEYLFGMSEELTEAYARLQAFYYFLDEQANTQGRRRAFGNWISVSQSCGVPEMESAAKTFKKHRENILNGFRLDKTNAPAEGVNNAIKALKRACFGFKGFKRMRKRCLLTLGTYQLEESHIKLKEINRD